MSSAEKSRAFLHKLLQNLPRLPFDPALLPALFTMTSEDSNVSTSDLVALIERSEKLAFRVLSVANSASYGLEYKVATLDQAVKILGIREIRLLVLMVGVSGVIGEVKLPPSFDIAALWDHHMKTAAIARILAANLTNYLWSCGIFGNEEDRMNITPEEAYIAGLMHDIGKIFFAASRPDLWEDVEKSWKKDEQRYFEAENKYWDIDHALIGAGVLHHWKLPLLLTEAINWHHAPELASAHAVEARLLAAADHMAHSSDIDLENEQCKEAFSLLPAGVDESAIVLAVSQGLTSFKSEVLAALAT